MTDRVLFVGDLAPHCRTYQRFNALGDLGYDVRGWPTSPVDEVPGITADSFWWKVSYKLKRPLDRTNANGRMVALTSCFEPSLVFIERGLTIRARTLRRMREISKTPLTLISYSEDDMFAPHNQSVYYRACLPLYDVVFTTKSYNCDPGELPSLGARRVLFVDKAFDRHAHRPIELSPEEREHYAADVGFIGTFEADRARQLLLIAQNGFHVRVWGNFWRDWVGKHPNLRVENRPLYGDDYVKALRATKINLCFLRKANRDLQTDRTMELPACGAFMLAERTAEHKRLFEEGREAAYFNVDDDDELIAKISYYLSNSEERRTVAAAGYRRAMNSGYSHHDRLEWMFEQVGSKHASGAAVR